MLICLAFKISLFYLYVQVLQLWKCNLKRNSMFFFRYWYQNMKKWELALLSTISACSAGPWMWNTCTSGEKHPTLPISTTQKLALEHVASVSIKQSVSQFCWHLLTWARYNSKQKENTRTGTSTFVVNMSWHVLTVHRYQWQNHNTAHMANTDDLHMKTAFSQLENLEESLLFTTSQHSNPSHQPETTRSTVTS